MNIQILDLLSPLWQQTLQSLRHDIYHLPEYVDLEARRINAIPEAILIVEDEKIFFLPYLVRRCDELFELELTAKNFLDVVSPYGYPGILLSEAAASTPDFLELAISHLIAILRERNICSAFLRMHPILNLNIAEICFHDIFQLSGETVSVNLRLSQTEIWHQTRPDYRRCINGLKRSGMEVKMVSFKQYLNEFMDIYEETMNRVSAAKFYYFDREYFEEFSKLDEKIKLCIVQQEDRVTCAYLFTECCGIVQAHLGGAKTEFLKEAHDKLMFDYARTWAKERGNEVLHLGGGVGCTKDGLYYFKAGFSKERKKFITMRLILDKIKYQYLVELRAKLLNTQADLLLSSIFFPAYRCLK